MRARRNIIIILSIIILIFAAYSVATAICSFAESQQSTELFELLNTSALFLTACALSCFVYFHKKLSIKFLFLPCVFLIANLIISIASRLITKVGNINEIALLDIYFFIYCCFGIISFILVAIDLNRGFLSSKFDIRILTIYWIIGTIAIIGYIIGITGNLLGVLYIIPSVVNPVFLLILILKNNIKAIADATPDESKLL